MDTPVASGSNIEDEVEEHLKKLDLPPDILRQVVDAHIAAKQQQQHRREREQLEQHSLKQQQQQQQQQQQHQRIEQRENHANQNGVQGYMKRQALDVISPRGGGGKVAGWSKCTGQPSEIEAAYGALVDYVSGSWELYKAELEAITFPLFVHCYLILANGNEAAKAKSLMRAWGSSHEAMYRDEISALRRVTAREHVEASEYAQLVLHNKFRVHLSLMASKLLDSFLVNSSLLGLMHILNTRVEQVLEERPPLPHVQRVRCDPRGGVLAIPRGAGAGAERKKVNEGDDGADAGQPLVNWAAGPTMEVALLKQSEKEAVAEGLSYPLRMKPEAILPTSRASNNVSSTNGDDPSTVPDESKTGGGPSGASTIATSEGVGGTGGNANVAQTPIPGGNAAVTAKVRARAGRVAIAAEAATKRAKTLGGLTQKEIRLPKDKPPLPDATEQWPRLRLTLRPLDSRRLEDVLAANDAGAQPFIADPFSPHVIMLTFFNSHETLCCMAPTRDGTQVAAGFSDRVLRAWKTAPKAPFPRTADGLDASGTEGETETPRQDEDVSKPQSPDESNAPKQGEDSTQQPARFVGHSRPVYAVSWSPDGRFLLSGGGDGLVRLWDLTQGSGATSGLARYDGHTGPVWGVAFGPSGYYFATAGADRTACLWSTDCPQPLRMFAGHLKGVLSVCFHPNGEYVITGSEDRTVRAWEVQSGRCVRLLAGHSESISCVAVSPGGRHIAAGSMDKDIRLWDISSGGQVALFRGHRGNVECLDFSAEGSALVSGGQDQHVMVWDVASALGVVAEGEEVADHQDDEKEANQQSVLATGKKSGAVWSSRTEEPGYSPAHAYRTRDTAVYSVLFTKRNMVVAAGVCSGKHHL